MTVEHTRRLISAAVLVPLVLFFLIYASHPFVVIAVCSVMLMSLYEYFELLSQKCELVFVRSSYLLSILLSLFTYLYGVSGILLVFSISIFLLTLYAIIQSERVTSSSVAFLSLSYCLFGILLIGLGLSYLILLHSLVAGDKAIILLLAVVWIGDAAAMYSGKALGRRKMVPTISPAKTWEGAMSGLASGAIVAYVGGLILQLPIPTLYSLALGVMISAAAQVSDLAESLLKRYAGAKDSGTLIPGHGGLLDRIDSLFFASPLMFYLFQFLTTDQFLDMR